MPNLVPYQRNPLALRGRQAVSEVREARRPARRAAARLDAASLVARVALIHVEALTATETAVCQRQGAVIDIRARMIVDTYSALAVAELNGLGLGGE